ncbi:DUF4190 domain-containing protein [Streptomyces sp. NBC_01353]|uniref:DUF4190 domain-containing protein n=1 Tax=Streptomyces sp. NBC_01353 TaxID=2903835 RepID=UPI002E37B17E|nr:DUF4190 domain-containing protein [Streptomyces sp. NBC_01353]
MTMPTNTPGQSSWSPPPAGMPGMPPQPPFQQPRNGLGVTALVLGIVGLLFAIFPFSFWLGGILGVLALIFGIIGHSRGRKGEATNTGMALTGLILGALSIVVSIVWLIVVVTAVKDIAEDIDKEIEKQEKATAAPAEPGAAPTEAEPTETAPAALKFGQTFAYEDGIKVTVSKPRAYEPDQFAAGHAKGNSAFQVTVTIVNGSKKTLDVSGALVDASDAEGSRAEPVFDGSNATEMFQGNVLPGKQAKADFTFSVTPKADGELQVELSPTILDHEEAIWTGPTK